MTGLSKRRQSILAELKRTGYFSARAAEFATLNTRQAKRELPVDQLCEAWRRECEQLGFAPSRVDCLLQQKQPCALSTHELQERLDAIIERISQSRSHFATRDIVREAAHTLTGAGVSGHELIASIEWRLEHSADIIPLQEINGERQYATRRTAAIESELLSTCDRLAGSKSFAVSERVARRALKRFPGVLRRPEQT
jgi:hypothetical protein